MTHPVITIGRQFGSGGRMIGELVAKELGISYFDRRLIDETAEKSGLSAAYIKANEEKLPNETLFGSASFGGVFCPYTPYVPYSNLDKMYFTQSELIRQLAEKGPCVIIGRCANFVLKDYPGTFSLFIHASRKSRVGRIIRRYNVEPELAVSELSKMDKHRANYYGYYTDGKWGHIRGYHMALDSMRLGLEDSAKLIVGLYRHQLVKTVD